MAKKKQVSPPAHKQNIIFAWGRQTQVTPDDMDKARRLAQNPGLEMLIGQVNTLTDAVYLLETKSINQFFHKGPPPPNAYLFLGGVRLEEVRDG